MQPFLAIHRHILILVSILIQPEGRMQLAHALAAERFSQFQSSSSQKAGCNLESSASALGYIMFQSSSSQKAGCNWAPTRPGSDRRSGCFNPHPARRPDATFTMRTVKVANNVVSILIQPEGRMQHGPDVGGDPGPDVSILIQPEGRMQHA